MKPAKKTLDQLRSEKHTAVLRQGFRVWPELKYGRMPALGDHRWTADLILATWAQAGTGSPPTNGLEYRVGDSGGGFDVLDFQFLPPEDWLPDEVPVDTSIPLNRRPYDRKIDIPVPWYGGGMSYGSISEQVMLSRARAAQALQTFTSTKIHDALEFGQVAWHLSFLVNAPGYVSGCNTRLHERKMPHFGAWHRGRISDGIDMRRGRLHPAIDSNTSGRGLNPCL